jgi:gliding motility-associated protein GldM
MALPQEPRQKMINLMYLVLTALLALNVSSEILNAFQVVDKSMQGSTKITNASTEQIMSSFETKKKDPSSRANAEIWAPKAQKAIDLCKKAYDDIEAAKKQMLSMKDTSISKDNLEASTHIFVEEKGGEAIYDKMVQLQKDLWAIDPVIAKEFAEGLPIDFAKTDPDKAAWAYKSFHMMPTVAALTMLSKFQADVKTSENKIAAYCHSKVGEVVVKYDNFSALVGQSSNYLMPGQKITITGGLGAYSSTGAPSVSINGQNIAVNGGKGSLDIDGGGAGEHSANVTVTFKDQNGISQTKTETVKWTVGQPAGAAVYLEKMNVLYIGIANPLSVAGGAGADKTSASISQGRLESKGSLSYNAWVTTPGTATINVVSDGKTSSIPFRVKDLPPATVYCANQKTGAIPSALLKAQGGLSSRLENCEYEAGFEVVSYKVTINSPKTGFLEAQNNGGNRWTDNAAKLINSCTPGTSVTFENIKVKGPSGKVVSAANDALSFICR